MLYKFVTIKYKFKMKTLLYSNDQKTLHCEMIVDAIGSNDEMTIMKLMGVTENLVRLGFNHDIKPFTMVEAKKIAKDLNLSLSIFETGKSVEVVNAQEDPFEVVTTSLPNGQVGVTYSEEIVVSGGNLVPGDFYEIEYGTGNNLPAGLQFNENTLTLEGEPEEDGTGFKLQISIIDSLGAKVNFEESFDVAANSIPQFISTAVTSGTVGNVYTYNIAATDLDNHDLTIIATLKPDWLTLTDNGDGTAILTGTPTEAGNFDVTIQVSDGIDTDDQSFTIVVA